MTHRIRESGKFRRLCGAALLTALSVTPVVFTASAAQARPEPGAVITWNLHAETAIHDVAQQSPTASSRSFAIVQGAVYDAVNAIAGAPYQPYLIAPRSRPGDSTPAAVAPSGGPTGTFSGESS